MKSANSADQPAVIGIDVGTEGARAAAFSLHGDLLSQAESSYGTRFPKPGWAEQNPEAIWEALSTAVRQCVHDTPLQVQACSLASTAVSAVALNTMATPITPSIMWMDTRAAREAEEITATGDPALWYTGGTVSPEWMLPKALWLKRHEPDLWQSARWFVDVHDWLVNKLTGRLVGATATASAEWSYDPAGGWPVDLLASVDLSDVVHRWPEQFLEPGEIIGPLTEEASRVTGLRAGLPIIQGLMDSYAGAIACNVFRPGRVTVSLGTSSAYIGLIETPVSDRRLLGPVRDGVGRGTYVAQGGQTSAGALVRWFCSELGCGMSAGELDQLAWPIAPGADGLLAIDTWQGSRTPHRDPMRRGAFVGLSLAHRREHLYRAVLESVAFGGRQVLEALLDVGARCSEIVIAGGGSRSQLWTQIHADVLGVPVTPLAQADQVALGAAMCAAVGNRSFTGLRQAASAMSQLAQPVAPIAANEEAYKAHFMFYQRASDRLGDIRQAH
jgi:sugar (pentulose or hexulose) kinase